MIGRWMTWATSPRPMTPTRSLLTGTPRSWTRSDLDPGGVVGCRALDGVQHALDLEAVGERRRRWRPGAHVPDEVGDLVHEGVLVAESVTGWPPGTGERVVGLGDEDAAEARIACRTAAVVHLELVHGLEVEGDAAVGAVELDAHGVLAAGGEARRLVRRQGAAIGTPEE